MFLSRFLKGAPASLLLVTTTCLPAFCAEEANSEFANSPVVARKASYLDKRKATPVGPHVRPLALMPTEDDQQQLDTKLGAEKVQLEDLWQAAISRAKQAKKYAITQEQATILYKVLRQRADELVRSYREYKHGLTSYENAQRDLADLKAMETDQLTLEVLCPTQYEFVRRKATRERDNLGENVRKARQRLIDLAGSDAVAKLDIQLKEEREMTIHFDGETDKTRA